MATVRVTIDGRPASFADGTTILGAARHLGIEIPTLNIRDPTGTPEYEVTAVRVERMEG